jgi:tetratricopeptide (TPR) repeat protein
MDIDDEILKADTAIQNGEYERAKDLFFSILSEMPECGSAHNSIGWLYKVKFSDPEKAEKHYKLAIKFSPKFPSSYLNYIYMLRDEGRISELEDLLNRAKQVVNLSKCSLYDEFGSLYELKGDFTAAIENYKKSIQYCLNNDTIEDLKKHIKRCESKKSFFTTNRLVKAFRVLINKD